MIPGLGPLVVALVWLAAQLPPPQPVAVPAATVGLSGDQLAGYAALVTAIFTGLAQLVAMWRMGTRVSGVTTKVDVVDKKADVIQSTVDGKATAAAAQIAALHAQVEGYKHQLDAKDQVIHARTEQLAEHRGAANLAGSVVDKVDQVVEHVKSTADSLSSPLPVVSVDRRDKERRAKKDDET